ncbi:hypothetical protein V6N12_035998 [Hibiscus sabdariffa]|uniref:Glycosyltransferase n=1 Tax=Hibiscus sabdariffa TaxID=183260 RepID=A0ABR2EPC3_9ROSI
MSVVFTGMLQGEELSQAYASGDVFVMPSEFEMLGQEGKTDFLFTPGDIEDCMSKLLPLLHNKVLRETIGQAAREEMKKYDWKEATRMIRNEEYNDAIMFWRKKRA